MFNNISTGSDIEWTGAEIVPRGSGINAFLGSSVISPRYGPRPQEVPSLPAGYS